MVTVIMLVVIGASHETGPIQVTMLGTVHLCLGDDGLFNDSHVSVIVAGRLLLGNLLLEGSSLD
jgi:hypothetical protein